MGRGWLLPCKSVAEQFQEHERLVDGAHAHAPGDALPEALVGGGGVGGMEQWRRLQGAWTRCGLGRPVRKATLLGSLLVCRPSRLRRLYLCLHT